MAYLFLSQRDQFALVQAVACCGYSELLTEDVKVPRSLMLNDVCQNVMLAYIKIPGNVINVKS